MASNKRNVSIVKQKLRNKHIFILGAGWMQCPILETAKKMGMIITCIDKDSHAPGLAFSDFVINSSLNEEEKTLARIDKFLSYFPVPKIDGVLTVGTDYSLLVSKIAAKYHLTGISKKTAEACTQKDVMRKVLKKGGLTQPLFLTREISPTEDIVSKFNPAILDKGVSAKTDTSFQQSKNEDKHKTTVFQKNNGFAANLSIEKLEGKLHAWLRDWEEKCNKEAISPFPAVVKPVSSMGARGVSKATEQSSFISACQEALKHSKNLKIIIEKFISGKKEYSGEMSIDAIIYKKNVTITGIADRHISHDPYFIEDGHTIPSSRQQVVIEKSVDEFKKAIAAVGIENGFAKADIIFDKSGPIIGEIAARLSGGFMSSYTFPLTVKNNLMEDALMIACGFAPSGEYKSNSTWCAERAFYAPVGIIKKISGLEQLNRHPSVKAIFLKTNTGEYFSNPKNNLMKAGNVLVVENNYEKAKKNADQLIKKIVFESRSSH